MKMRYNKSENESVDLLTGEPHPPVRYSFICSMVSDDIDWMLLLNYNELILMQYLVTHGGMKGVAEVTNKMKEYISKKMKFSGRTLRNSLNGLIEIGFIKETDIADTYLLHPLTSYKGSLKDTTRRVEYYINYKKEQK